MKPREADDITVAADDGHEGRSVVSVVHGNYTTSLRVSDGELTRIRDAIDAHLSAAPADDTTDHGPGFTYVGGNLWNTQDGPVVSAESTRRTNHADGGL